MSKPTAGHANVRSVPLPWSDWLSYMRMPSRIGGHAI